MSDTPTQEEVREAISTLETVFRELKEQRSRLIRACRLLLCAILPTDVSGERMVQEARDIVARVEAAIEAEKSIQLEE